MSEHRKNLERLLGLHNRARDSIVPQASVEEIQKINIGFWAYLVISTHSHIVEENKKIEADMLKKYSWDKEKIRALIKYLSHFTIEEENDDPDFAQSVRSYIMLDKARNHLAHKKVHENPFPYSWDGQDVVDNCVYALEFPSKLREYAEKYVQHARSKHNK